MDGQARPNGLITVCSGRDFRSTVEALTGTLAERGVTVFAVVDHAAGAKGAGLELRPTTVVVFGDPRAGTILMQACQSIGIDLPLRVLVFEDEEGQVRLAYNDPVWLARRHGLDPDALPVVGRMSGALKAVVAAAAKP